MCTNSGCKSNIELFSFKPFSCSNRGDNTILIICVVVIFISLILCCIFSIYGIKWNIFTGGNYKHIQESECNIDYQPTFNEISSQQWKSIKLRNIKMQLH